MLSLEDIPLRGGRQCNSWEWNPLIPARGRLFIIDPCHGKWPPLNSWSASVLRCIQRGHRCVGKRFPRRGHGPRASWKSVIRAKPPAPPQNCGLKDSGSGAQHSVLASPQGCTASLHTPGVVGRAEPGSNSEPQPPCL